MTTIKYVHINNTKLAFTNINKKIGKFLFEKQISDQINKNKSKIGYIFNNTKPPPPLPSSINSSVPKGYIVYGPQCKIIDINAHESDAMALFRVQRYSDCSKKKPLTRLINNYTSGEVILHYDNGVRKKFYSIIKSCCYQEIYRVESKNSSADDLWT